MRIAMAMLMFANSAAVSLAQGEDALRRRFFEEAPRRWQEMRGLAGLLQGEMNYTSESITGGERKLSRRWQYQIKQTNAWKLFIIRNLFTTNPNKVLPRAASVNSKYAFTVSEKKAGQGWVLGELDLKSAAKKPVIELTTIKDDVDRTACPHLRINQMPLAKLVGSKSFQLRKINRRNGHDGDEVIVHFEYAEDGSSIGAFKGEILFDSENYWVVKSANLVLDIGTVNERTEQLENAYFISPRGLPIAKSTTARSAGKNFSHEEKWLYDLFEQPDVPEHEFSLSAFGLPEPMGSEIRQPSSRWHYLWLPLAGIALIVGGIVATRLARRWQATPEAEPK